MVGLRPKDHIVAVRYFPAHVLDDPAALVRTRRRAARSSDLAMGTDADSGVRDRN